VDSRPRRRDRRRARRIRPTSRRGAGGRSAGVAKPAGPRPTASGATGRRFPRAEIVVDERISARPVALEPPVRQPIRIECTARAAHWVMRQIAKEATIGVAEQTSRSVLWDAAARGCTATPSCRAVFARRRSTRTPCRRGTRVAASCATTSRWWTLSSTHMSDGNRSQCRPGTGTASAKCQPTTGATTSSMNRCRTDGPPSDSPI
jgi:hypothetical protein